MAEFLLMLQQQQLKSSECNSRCSNYCSTEQGDRKSVYNTKIATDRIQFLSEWWRKVIQLRHVTIYIAVIKEHYIQQSNMPFNHAWSAVVTDVMFRVGMMSSYIPREMLVGMLGSPLPQVLIIKHQGLLWYFREIHLILPFGLQCLAHLNSF